MFRKFYASIGLQMNPGPHTCQENTLPSTHIPVDTEIVIHRYTHFETDHLPGTHYVEHTGLREHTCLCARVKGVHFYSANYFILKQWFSQVWWYIPLIPPLRKWLAWSINQVQDSHDSIKQRSSLTNIQEKI